MRAPTRIARLLICIVAGAYAVVLTLACANVWHDRRLLWRPPLPVCAWHTGDLVFARNFGMDFALQSMVSQSVFSHVGIVLAPPHVAQPLLLEAARATTQGTKMVPSLAKNCIRCQPLAQALEQYRIQWRGRCTFTVRKLRGAPVTGLALPLAQALVQRAAGTFPSDMHVLSTAGCHVLSEEFPLLLGMMLPEPDEMPEGMFMCSTFVSVVLTCWGVCDATQYQDIVAPKWFEVGEHLGLVDRRLNMREPYSYAPGCELQVGGHV